MLITDFGLPGDWFRFVWWQISVYLVIDFGLPGDWFRFVWWLISICRWFIPVCYRSTTVYLLSLLTGFGNLFKTSGGIIQNILLFTRTITRTITKHHKKRGLKVTPQSREQSPQQPLEQSRIPSRMKTI